MSHYILYKTTNLIDGKIYIGAHKTEDLDDSYMGSGRRLLSAISKYGIENFERTILEHFSDAESMYAREREIVNEEFLNREDVYNLKIGGEGGFDWINDSGIGGFKGRAHTEETRKKISNALIGRKRPDLSENWHQSRTDESRAKHSASMSRALKGKKKSESHKAKIREAIIKRYRSQNQVDV